MAHFNFRYLSAVLVLGNILLAVSTVYYHGAFQRNWQNYSTQRIQNSQLEIQLRELQNELDTLRRKQSSGNEARQIERLQRDLTKLNEILDLREQEIGELQAKFLGRNNRKNTTQQNRPKPAPRKSYKEYMEQLQKNDPEKYNRIKSRMEEYASRKKALTDKRDQYFDKLDKEKMTTEQQTLVSDYLTLIQLNNDLISENKPENRKDIWQNNRLLMGMQEGIRDVLLQQETGNPDKAGRIKEIYEITSPRAVFGSMGHMGRF